MGLFDRMKAIDDAARARNTKMIEQNWGSVQNYQKLQQPQPAKQKAAPKQGNVLNMPLRNTGGLKFHQYKKRTGSSGAFGQY
jgi:hypothetical protein